VEEGASESGVDVLAGSISKALGCHVRAYDAGAKGPVEGATSGPGHAEGTVETPQVVPTSEPQVSSDVADEEDDAGAYEDIKLKLASLGYPKFLVMLRMKRCVKRIAVSTVESAAVEGLQEDSDGNEEEGSPEDDPAIDPFDEEAWMNRPFTPVAIDPDVTARHHQEAEHDARLAEIRDRPLGAPPSEALLAEEDIPSADAEATSSLANERRPIWNAHLFGPSTRKYWNFGHPAEQLEDSQAPPEEVEEARLKARSLVLHLEALH
ncbi:hypothetical protein EMWEY_00014250, partial [Eimeria maxima]